MHVSDAAKHGYGKVIVCTVDSAVLIGVDVGYSSSSALITVLVGVDVGYSSSSALMNCVGCFCLSQKLQVPPSLRDGQCPWSRECLAFLPYTHSEDVTLHHPLPAVEKDCVGNMEDNQRGHPRILHLIINSSELLECL